MVMTLRRRRNPRRLVHLPLLVRERGKAMHLANQVVPTSLLQVGKPKRYNGRMKKTTGLLPMFPLYDTRVVTRRRRATKTRSPHKYLFLTRNSYPVRNRCPPSLLLPSTPLLH